LNSGRTLASTGMSTGPSMTGSARRPGRSTSGGSDAPDFLGDQSHDVALFAARTWTPGLLPVGGRGDCNLRAAVDGTLPVSRSRSARELLTRNAAAAELVMSEQLWANANRKGALPPDYRTRFCVETGLPPRSLSLGRFSLGAMRGQRPPRPPRHWRSLSAFMG
jgi:hypothetical protein